MAEENHDCCCCEMAVDLTLAAWETWGSAPHPELTPERAAELIAAMYAKIHPIVAGNCTCGCR